MRVLWRMACLSQVPQWLTKLTSRSQTKSPLCLIFPCLFGWTHRAEKSIGKADVYKMWSVVLYALKLSLFPSISCLNLQHTGLPHAHHATNLTKCLTKAWSGILTSISMSVWTIYWCMQQTKEKYCFSLEIIILQKNKKTNVDFFSMHRT